MMMLGKRWISHSSSVVGNAELARAGEPLRNNFVGHGPIAAELERKFCERTARRHAFAVQSGYHALSLALRALDLGSSARVAIPVLTCASVLEAVRGAGAEAVISDIAPASLELDVSSISPGVDAVIAPHAYGAPVDVLGLQALGCPWIEDCATSPATIAAGKPAGSWGTLAVFSFGSTKYITAGAGGMLVMDDPCLAGRVADLLDFERRDPKRWQRDAPAALPGRLPDLNAAVALAQLDRLAEFRECRLQIAKVYNGALKGMADLELPADLPGHSYFRYVCRTGCPSEPVAARLRGAGIDARSSVNPWLDELVHGPGRSMTELPGVSVWRGHLLSLPIHPQMTPGDARFVSDTLHRIWVAQPQTQS